MLLLLQRWLERHAPKTHLVAATVDHQLRAASAGEAEAVRLLCSQLGIPHRTLVWEGEKPRSGVAAAGRLARYGLLAAAAKAEGTDVIVTGHTSDDQAETIAMRQARSDGRGLAGMAAATLFDGCVWILRPLLTAKRASLRNFLQTQGVRWIDDPSNVDLKYERPRTRMALAGRGEGAESRELLRIAEEAGRKRAETAGEAGRLLAAFVDCPAQGLLRLDRKILSAEDEPLRFTLRTLLAVSGGVAELPDDKRVGDLLRRLRAETPFRATLSRTVVDARRVGIFLHRERRGLPGSRAAIDHAIWDGRYRLAIHAAGITVEPGAALEKPDDAASGKGGDLPASLVRAASAAQPRFADSSWQVVGADMASVVPVLAPWRLFLPSFDLPAAQAVAALLRSPKVPRPPFAGHNAEEA